VKNLDRSLRMVFLNEAGKNVSINIAGIKDTITPEEIKALMQLIVAKNIFESTGGNLVSIMSADITAREVQEIAVK